MIGKWIDQLDMASKDRIVEAQGWGYAGVSAHQKDHNYDSTQGRFCLMDNAAGECGVWYNKEAWRGPGSFRKPPAIQFDALCNRFGMHRIVRACKMRAAKPQHMIAMDKPSHIVGDRRNRVVYAQD